MPVETKVKLDGLIVQLRERYDYLMYQLEPRKLESSSEGCKGRNHWIAPERMRSTRGDSTALRIALTDFQAVLSEVKRLAK